MEAKQPEKNTKRKIRGHEMQERAQKRRKADYSVYSPPIIEGAAAQVRGWSYGNLSKKEASLFARAVYSVLSLFAFFLYLMLGHTILKIVI